MTDRQTDRPTDHASRSVTIGRIYIRSTGMRRNNNDWYWVTGIALSLKKSKRACLYCSVFPLRYNTNLVLLQATLTVGLSCIYSNTKRHRKLKLNWMDGHTVPPGFRKIQVSGISGLLSGKYLANHSSYWPKPQGGF